MTAAQPAGAASHTLVVSSTAVRIGRRSVSSRFYSFVVESDCVLVFQEGVLECSSRMKGNFQVRFLEGWPPAMGAGYSADISLSDSPTSSTPLGRQALHPKGDLLAGIEPATKARRASDVIHNSESDL